MTLSSLNDTLTTTKQIGLHYESDLSQNCQTLTLSPDRGNQPPSGIESLELPFKVDLKIHTYTRTPSAELLQILHEKQE